MLVVIVSCGQSKQKYLAAVTKSDIIIRNYMCGSGVHEIKEYEL